MVTWTLCIESVHLFLSQWTERGVTTRDAMLIIPPSWLCDYRFFKSHMSAVLLPLAFALSPTARGGHLCWKLRKKWATGLIREGVYVCVYLQIIKNMFSTNRMGTFGLVHTFSLTLLLNFKNCFFLTWQEENIKKVKRHSRIQPIQSSVGTQRIWGPSLTYWTHRHHDRKPNGILAFFCFFMLYGSWVPYLSVKQAHRCIRPKHYF